jgi:hypothetical protein
MLDISNYNWVSFDGHSDRRAVFLGVTLALPEVRRDLSSQSCIGYYAMFGG